MKDLLVIIDKFKFAIFLLIAFISIAVGYIRLGTSMNFWTILLVWVIFYLLFFFKPSRKPFMFYSYIATIIVSFFFTIFVSFGLILPSGSVSSNSPKAEKSADGVILASCTSTIDDKPAAMDGWTSTIYSAKLESSTPDIGKASEVRTFSYNGIKNKTEENSLYVRIEKTDGSHITGFGTTMEACSSDNKTSKYYTTSDTNHTASENVVASTHYFHGGKYLYGPGDYRVDVYIKTLDGVWHLVDRMTDIKITD